VVESTSELRVEETLVRFTTRSHGEFLLNFIPSFRALPRPSLSKRITCTPTLRLLPGRESLQWNDELS
jgi:hypothetical protein